MGEGGKLEHSSSPGSVNNFQARYAIRHEWKGPIECKEPRRGIWGGPPGGQHKPETKPATDLAFATRGNIRLASVVPAGIPELGVAASGASIYGGGDGVVSSDPPIAKPRPRTVLPPFDGKGDKSSSDDGCSLAGGKGSSLGMSLLLLGLFFGGRRRRRG